MGPEQLQPKLIAASQYLYLEGYLLTSDSGFAACVEAQRLAQSAGTAVSLTLSDPAIVQFCKERFTQLVDSGVDLLFCNDEEAQAFTGVANREEAAQTLAKRAKTVCVTCGPDGALLFDQAGRCQVPGVVVEALDTTGAGDLFAGGVLFGLTKRLQPKTGRAIRILCRRPGSRPLRPPPRYGLGQKNRPDPGPLQRLTTPYWRPYAYPGPVPL